MRVTKPRSWSSSQEDGIPQQEGHQLDGTLKKVLESIGNSQNSSQMVHETVAKVEVIHDDLSSAENRSPKLSHKNSKAAADVKSAASVKPARLNGPSKESLSQPSHVDITSHEELSCGEILSQTGAALPKRRQSKTKLKDTKQRGIYKSIGASSQVQADWKGNALKHLEDNQYRTKILKMVTDQELFSKNMAVRQLRSAIVGDGFQCQRCAKYQPSELWAPQHAKRCKSENPQTYRLAYAKLEGSYFCYFGCSKFKKRQDLTDHLLERHYRDLFAWGISAKDLAAPKRDSQHDDAQAEVCLNDSDDFGMKTATDLRQAKDAQSKATVQAGYAEPSKSGAQSKPTLSSYDHILLCSILQASKGVLSTPSFPPPDMSMMRRHERQIYKIYCINWLRADVGTSFRVITNYQKSKRVALMCPELELVPPTIYKTPDDMILVHYLVGVRTPQMLWRQNLQKRAKFVFLRVLDSLTSLHRDHKIFQGGVTLSNIGIRDGKNDAYFLSWEFSTELNGFETRVKPTYLTYWRQAELCKKSDLFTLDILALLFAYGEFISRINTARSCFRTLRLLRGGVTMPYTFTTKSECVLKFSGGVQLDRMLHKYTGPGDVCYDELVKEFEDYLKADFYEAEDVFATEWKDEVTKRREAEYRRELASPSRQEDMELSESDCNQ